MDTQPRVAVVTGAAGGIGASIAAELTHRSWRVAGLDLQPCAWDLSLRVDVSDSASVSNAVTEVERELGPVETIITAAGHYAMDDVLNITATQWHTMLRVHVGGLVNLVRAVLPSMTARGLGSIVAVTSELAIGGGDRDVHYAAAKGAIVGLVRSLAIEVADTGVRVNAVAPGPTDTPLVGPDSPWRDPAYLAGIPLRRMVAPHEVALTVGYLVEEATFMTGEILSPNAGAVI